MIAPRATVTTVTFVDDYCAAYSHLFSEVRTEENFKYLHLGMISDIKRKSLPEIARAVGLHDSQPLQNFLTDSPWSVTELRERRLALSLEMLKGQSIKLVIDETGDKKKGNHTDYVARQYIGNLGKVENGIVSVNAYGVLGDITFPLMFKIYKPKTTLKEGDSYKTKPQLAAEIIEDLQKKGFKFNLVLADSLYGESGTFITVLNKYSLLYLVAIRSNHGGWLPPGEDVTYGEWKRFYRIFTDGTIEYRYIQEIRFGSQKPVTYWKITTDKGKQPKNQTWYVMTNLTGDVEQKLGNLYGFRNWIEYSFKQAKNELGWADFRVTDYKQIEKWWEIVMSAYLMVSLQAQSREPTEPPEETNELEATTAVEPPKFSSHTWWDFKRGWKSTLNNLRLIVQPYIFFNLIKPWLSVFNIQCLKEGFLFLIEIMNEFRGYMPQNSG
jgi:SRSO17 transposase